MTLKSGIGCKSLFTSCILFSQPVFLCLSGFEFVTLNHFNQPGGVMLPNLPSFAVLAIICLVNLERESRTGAYHYQPLK